MRWEEVTPSEAVENADWIVARLHPFNSYDVGAVIPTGFAAYAKILHPASTWRDHTDVRWSDVAASTGKVIHPLVQFHAPGPVSRDRQICSGARARGKPVERRAADGNAFGSTGARAVATG